MVDKITQGVMTWRGWYLRCIEVEKAQRDFLQPPINPETAIDLIP